MSSEESFIDKVDAKIDATKQFAKAWWTRNDAISDMAMFEGRMLLFAGTRAYVDANNGLEREVALKVTNIAMESSSGLGGTVLGGLAGGLTAGPSGLFVGSVMGGLAGSEWGDYRFEKEVKPIIDKYLPEKSESIKREYFKVLEVCGELSNQVWYDRDISHQDRSLRLEEIKKKYLSVASELEQVDPVISRAVRDYVGLTLEPRLIHLSSLSASQEKTVSSPSQSSIVRPLDNNKQKSAGEVNNKASDGLYAQEVKLLLDSYGVNQNVLDDKTRFMITEIARQYEENYKKDKLKQDSFNFLSDAFGLIGLVAEINGSRDLMKVAQVGAQAVNVAKAVSLLPDAIAALGSGGGLFAVANPVMAIAMGGLAIFSILKSRKQNADQLAWQNLMKEVGALSKQINTLSQSMQKHFAHVYHGQALIYQALIESTQYLDRRIYQSIQEIKAPLFFELDVIGNRLSLMSQILGAGLNVVELQSLMNYKDRVEYLDNRPQNFQGAKLISWEEVYQALLTWTRTHCKSHSLTGKSLLQAPQLKDIFNDEFSVDVYQHINEILGSDNYPFSLKTGYLIHFARQIIDMPFDINGNINLEVWLLSTQLLLKLQNVLISYGAIETDSGMFDLESVIRTGDRFKAIVEALQTHSPLLFQQLLIRYQYSYALFMKQLQKSIGKYESKFILNDERLPLSFSLFDERADGSYPLSLQQFIELMDKKNHKLTVLLSQSMLRSHASEKVENKEKFVNANTVNVNGQGSFEQMFDIKTVISQLIDQPESHSIPSDYFLSVLIGEGEIDLMIEEVKRHGINVYSPSPGVINGNPPGSATYRISLVYQSQQTRKPIHLLDVDYELNSPDRFLGTHDTRGNGARKMWDAISQWRQQFVGQYHNLSSVAYFHLIWKELKIKNVHFSENIYLPSQQYYIQLNEHNNSSLSEQYTLTSAIAKRKSDVLQAVKNDLALQKMLVRLDADFHLIHAFSELIGLDLDSDFGLVSGKEFDRMLQVYISGVSMKNTNMLIDPISNLRQRNMEQALAEIQKSIKTTKINKGFNSELASAIEDQLVELALTRTAILVMPTLVPKSFACNDDNLCTRSIEHENVISDHVSDAMLLAQKNIQTSAGNRLEPFYLYPFKIVYQSVMLMGENLVSWPSFFTRLYPEINMEYLRLQGINLVDFPEQHNSFREETSANTMLPCQAYQYNHHPVLVCYGEDYINTVFLKISEQTALVSYASQAGSYQVISGDIYDVRSCRPIRYYGQTAVYCEGEETTVVSQPIHQSNVMDNINAQLMLCLILIHGIRWLLSVDKDETCSTNLVDKKYYSHNDEHLLFRLFHMKARLKKMLDKIEQHANTEEYQKKLRWAKWTIEDYLDDIADLQAASNVSEESLKNLIADVEYFEDDFNESISTVCSPFVLQVVAGLKSNRSVETVYQLKPSESVAVTHSVPYLCIEDNSSCLVARR